MAKTCQYQLMMKHTPIKQIAILYRFEKISTNNMNVRANNSHGINNANITNLDARDGIEP